MTLRRATAGDLRVTDGKGGEVAKAIALVTRLSGLKPATVDLIDTDDFSALCDSTGMVIPGGEPG